MDPDMAAPTGYRVSALDIRRLSLFLAVVEHGGFTRAAQAVHISQPALSQAIAELEAELGGPLVHRLGPPVELTDAGAPPGCPAPAAPPVLAAAPPLTAPASNTRQGRPALPPPPTF